MLQLENPTSTPEDCEPGVHPVRTPGSFSFWLLLASLTSCGGWAPADLNQLPSLQATCKVIGGRFEWRMGGSFLAAQYRCIPSEEK